jgi:hypothetical protein
MISRPGVGNGVGPPTNMIHRTLLILILFTAAAGAGAPPASAPTSSPAGVTLSFHNAAGRLMDRPPVLKYGIGYMLLTAKWPTSFTDKDDVHYHLWAACDSTDWASANSTRDADGVWRQYAYLGTVREGGRSTARLKLSFGYRPAGLTAFTADRDATKLPEVLPLQPGKYRFTIGLQRVGPGRAVTDLAREPIEVTITGDTATGALVGLSDGQVVQRKNKMHGDITLQLVTAPQSTLWKATLTRDGTTINTVQGKVTADVETVTISDVPVGGPYTLQVAAGQLARTIKDLYVGDLWIISGQSNAVGVGHEMEHYRQPKPGVQALNPKWGINEWIPARDGLFEATMGPWVTAAQIFHEQTGVPVGLMGHAVGSKPMDYFFDAERGEPLFLRPLIERHGRGAAAFFWYQGESDFFITKSRDTYGPKLKGLVRAVRSIAGNEQMTAGIVQLGRYTWQKDDHFAVIREVQRQFVLADPRAVLYATIPYEVSKTDRIHLTSAAQAALGKQIAMQMAAAETSGKLAAPGPMLAGASFTGAERKQITIRFTNADGLTGGDTVDQWYVTDVKRGGFRDGGFVPISNVTVDPTGTVTLSLAEPAGDGAAVSYAYRSDIGGTLANTQGFAAPAFVKAPVQRP